MPYKFTTRTKTIFSTQISHVDILGKSDICRVLVEGVASAQPVELEREVNSATDGGSTEHCLKNVSLTMNTNLISYHIISYHGYDCDDGNYVC